MSRRNKTVRKFRTHAEADEAQYEEWAALTPEQAVRLVLHARAMAGIVDQRPGPDCQVEKKNWPRRN